MRNPKTKRKKEESEMNKSSRTETSESRIDFQLKGRLTDLRRLWTSYCSGDENEADRFSEYGLCFDFVAPSSFANQPEAYFRYQLSWGGPSDEFRFFVNPDLSCHRVEYWFLDWFDGASRVLSGDCAEPLSEIWDYFREAGLANSVYEKAGAQ
jgi:hypothetical protein